LQELWRDVREELDRNMTEELDVERILKYFEKIQTSEIMYCEGHDREFLEGEGCPGCRSEHDDYEIEISVGVRVQVKEDD
jgi:hypothetical protein